jgi:hypothetical protein
MSITRQQAKTVTEDIQAAIAGVMAKHGLTVDKVSTTYGTEYAFKVKASVHQVNDDGINVNSAEMDHLKYYGPMYGIMDVESDIAGESIHIDGREYRPAGYKPRASKRPFLMKCLSDGKDYVFPASVVKYFPSYDATQGFMNPANTWNAGV